MSSYGYGYGKSTYGYGYGALGYDYTPPYGHGTYTGYGFKSASTAGSFLATLGSGESESFDRRSGPTSVSVYAVRNVDGTSYGRYSTYNSATGLYHIDTVYGHPGPYSGYSYKTYYAHHSDGYTFSEQSSSYNYYPPGEYPSYLVDHEAKQYSYADGSSLEITDYFRSDSTHAYGGSTTTIDQSEAQTTTDPYGYSTYSFTSSDCTLSF